MTDIETKPTAEQFPNIPIYNLGQIADALQDNKQAVIYRNADMDTPYSVEYVASIPPDRSGRLRLWGQYVVATAYVPSYLDNARQGFQRSIRDLDIENLGASVAMHRSEQQHVRLGIGRSGGRERAVTGFFSKPGSSSPQFNLANNYDFSKNGNVSSRPPDYDKELLEEDLARYMGLFSLIERGFSRAEVPDYSVKLLELRDQSHPPQKNRGASSSKNKPNAVRDAEQQQKANNRARNLSEPALEDRELRLPDASVELSSVYGVDADDMRKIKRRIKVMNNRELAEHYGVASSGGILIEGEGGVGKTMLATGVANEVGGKIVEMNGEDVVDMYVGNSAKFTGNFFERLIALAETENIVLLINEVDAVIGIQTDRNEERNAALGVAKKKLEYIAKNVPGLLFIGTTNNKDRLDKAFMRSGRFDVHVYIPPPDDIAREQILIDRIPFNTECTYADDVVQAVKDTEPIFSSDMGDYNIAALVKGTKGMTGADIDLVFKECRLKAFDEHDELGHYPGPITGTDLLQEIENFRQRSHQSHKQD